MSIMLVCVFIEVVRKKFSKDYVSKSRFVWLDPSHQTLNW